MTTAGDGKGQALGRLATATMTLALLVAGCGGGDPETSTSATSSAVPTSQAPLTLPANGSATTGLTAATTTATRIPVSTTVAAPTGPTSIGPGLVPEATAGYDFDKATINGIDYSNALLIRASEYETETLEINAGRSRTRFLGSLGIPDSQKSSTVHEIEISLDGAPPILTTTLRFGETKELDIPVTGVLRIRITVLKSAGSAFLAIGDPRFT